MDLGIWGRRLAALLTAALVLGLALEVMGGVVAPAVIRRALQEHLQASLQRAVRIERVTVDPFTATVSLSGVRVAGDGPVPLLSVAQIEADLELPASIAARALVVRALRVEEPVVHVGARAMRGPHAGPPAWGGAAHGRLPAVALGPPRFSISNIQVRDARIEIEGETRGARHTLAAARLELPFWTSAGVATPVEPRVAPRFSGSIDGAPVEIQGTARRFATGMLLEAEVHVAGLEVGRWLALLPPAALRAMQAGRLTADGRVSFARDRMGQGHVRASGALTLDDVALSRAGAGGALLATAQRLSADVEAADLISGAVVMSRVALARPAFTLARDVTGALGDGWSELGGGAGALAAPHAPPGWRIDRLVVAGGRLLVERADASGELDEALDACTVEAWGISTDAVQPLTAGLSCAVRAGALDAPPAHVSATAEGTLWPLGLTGVARGRGLDPGALLAGVGIALHDTTVLDGRIDVRARFRASVSAAGARLTIFDASASARALRWRTRAGGRELARVAGLAVRDARFDSSEGRLVVEELSAREAWLRGTRRRDGSVDLARLIDPAAPGPRLLVEHVVVDSARVELRDHSVAPPVAFFLDGVALEGAALSSDPDVEGALALRGRVAGGGELSADARLPATRGEAAALRLRLRGRSRSPLERRLEALLLGPGDSSRSRLPAEAASARR